MAQSRNSLDSYELLSVGELTYGLYSLKAAERTLGSLEALPYTLRIVLENLLRHENENGPSVDDMRALTAYHAQQKHQPTVPFTPSNLVLNDEEAALALADLAGLDTVVRGSSPSGPFLQTSIRLSLALSSPSTADSFVPWTRQNLPTTRIFRAQEGMQSAPLPRPDIVAETPTDEGSAPLLSLETFWGARPILPVLNALSLLTWPTDALEAESLLLGYPLSLTIPPLIGVKITGKPHHDIAPMDIALTIMLLLQRVNAQGKIVEIFGAGLDHLSLSDRTLITSMAQSQQGASAVLFPFDAPFLSQLNALGTSPEKTAVIKAYAQKQGLWREEGKDGLTPPTAHNTLIDLALDAVRPTIGFKHHALSIMQLNEAGAAFVHAVGDHAKNVDPLSTLKPGDLLFASLGSPSAPLHPAEAIFAALLARQAKDKGLEIKPWVRAVMTPLPPALASFMKETGLQESLNALGFRTLDSYGMERLRANIDPSIGRLLNGAVPVGAVGTDDGYGFSPLRQACGSHLTTSAGLVIAYALAGTLARDLSTFSFGLSAKSKAITLKDLWLGAQKAYAEIKAPREVFLTQGAQAIQEEPASAQHGDAQTSPLAFPQPIGLSGFTPQPPPLEDMRNAQMFALYGDNVGALWLLQETERLTAARRAALSEPTTPFVLVAGERLGEGDDACKAAMALREAGVKGVIAQSYAPSFRLALVRLGLLPLQLKASLPLTNLKLNGQETLSLFGLPGLMQPPGEIMLTVDRGGEIERYMLRCRLDTEEEKAMFAHGSLLSMAARARMGLEVSSGPQNGSMT